jgi:hypothetical protein
MAGTVTVDKTLILDLIYLLRMHEAYQQAKDLQTSARCYELSNKHSESALSRETVRLRQQLELELIDQPSL